MYQNKKRDVNVILNILPAIFLESLGQVGFQQLSSPWRVRFHIALPKLQEQDVSNYLLDPHHHKLSCMLQKVGRVEAEEI